MSFITCDAYSELFGEDIVINTIEKIKTVHSAGCGGLSDIYQLNGQEISKWIHKKCCTTLMSTVESITVTASMKATHSLLSRWLKQLHDSLLHTNDWKPSDIEDWRGVVDDIQQHWYTETKIGAFPKLHMLRHAVEFAERYRFLGRASEAQIESFHAQFNLLFHKQHRNMSNHISERLRRCLADVALRVVQPIAISEI